MFQEELGGNQGSFGSAARDYVIISYYHHRLTLIFPLAWKNRIGLGHNHSIFILGNVLYI
jgi:hypothetical protein